MLHVKLQNGEVVGVKDRKAAATLMDERGAGWILEDQKGIGNVIPKLPNEGKQNKFGKTNPDYESQGEGYSYSSGIFGRKQ